ncbi:MAG: glycosyltransferase family 4 protein [Saprospiraceae bacterium]|nr:glycosyltransferase family 4 protein [Saprospiraceae bacterium]
MLSAICRTQLFHISKPGLPALTCEDPVPMRIAVNTRFLLPGKLEGLGWYTHELLRRMVLAHPEDEFIFLFDRPFDPAFVYAPNVHPVVLFPPARHPLLWYLWFEWAVPRALRQHRAAVFFSPDSYLSLRTRIPTVMTVHDLVPLQHPEQVPWWSRDYYRYFFPRFIRRATRLIAISAYTRDTMLAYTGVAPERIQVVHNGSRDGFVPLPEAEKATVRTQFSKGQPYFFYTGAIHPRKNIPRLIRAFDRFKARSQAPIQLLLAGRFAWQTGAVKAGFEQAEHRSDIHFLGYVPEPDLKRLMASALALVYVSLSEGFGLPVLEAMQAETPVICSRTTALPEVAGEAALLVDPLSEPEISEAMRQIWDNADLRAALVAKGRLQRQAFDWAAAAQAIYQTIRAAGR